MINSKATKRGAISEILCYQLLRAWGDAKQLNALNI
jgi:hypothetical protein